MNFKNKINSSAIINFIILYFCGLIVIISSGIILNLSPFNPIIPIVLTIWIFFSVIHFLKDIGVKK